MPKLYRIQFEDILNSMAKKIPTGSTVLDFACASGYRYRKFFNGCDYTGADICFEKTILVDDNTKIMFADFNDNPFDDETFDAIVSTNSINYSGDDQQVINNLNTLINKSKKGGCIITNINESYSGDLKKGYLDTIKSRYDKVQTVKYQGKIAMFASKLVDIAYKGNEQVNGQYKDPIFSRLWAIFMVKFASPILYYLVVKHFDFYDDNTGLMVFAEKRIV